MSEPTSRTEDLTHELALAMNREWDARAALALEQQVEDFDCPHSAEAPCGCGSACGRLILRARAARRRVLGQEGA